MAEADVLSLTGSKARKALTEMAGIIAQKAREKVGQNNLPRAISDAISVGEFQQTGLDVFSISVNVDLEAAPMGAAFELGSGIHGRTRSTYRIQPKEAAALAFEWEPQFVPWGSPKFIGLAGNKYLFRFVDHPGVAPRPYLLPAMLDNIDQISQILLDELLEVLFLSFERVVVEL